MNDKEIRAVQDDRIMADGRPAHAWWYELEMLRAQQPTIDSANRKLREQMIALRIIQWAIQHDVTSDDLLIRVKRGPLTTERHPDQELMEHPENFCTLERK